MTDEERERRRNDPKVKELKGKICNCESGKAFLFISYRSDDWETVLTKIVYKLVNEYHLNIYYDGSFELYNDSWIEQFPKNMDSHLCKGVLAFLDDAYATSYATLMELMHSQTFDAGDDDGLPIIPVNLGDLTNIGGAIGDESTGLGVGGLNLNAEAEKGLFESDYDYVMRCSDIKQGFKIYKNADKFKKKHCSKMVRELLAPKKGYNINMYSETPEFYENLVATIKNTPKCGEDVFSKAPNEEIKTTESTKSAETNISPTVQVSESTDNKANAGTSAKKEKISEKKKNDSKSAKKEKTSNDKKSSTSAKKEKISDNKKSSEPPVLSRGIPPLPDDSLKIGEFVYTAMRNLSESGYIFSDKEIAEMTTPAWATEKFHTNKPFIKVYIKGKTDNKGADGRVRYKATPYTFGKYQVLLSIEWYEKQRGFFIDWYNSLKNTSGGADLDNAKKSPVGRESKDLTYILYGEKYTDNQSNMMLKVFNEVLKRHPEAVDKILADSENPLMKCASSINYGLPANKKLPKTAYFSSGAYFDIGRGIFIGTAMNFPEKLKNISLLLTLCNEDSSVLQSKQFELPQIVKAKEENRQEENRQEANRRGDESYSVYGKSYSGNQAKMMIDVLKFLMEKHFDKRDKLAELLCIKLAPLDSLSNVIYFRAGEECSYNGIVYSIATSFSRIDKLKMLIKAIDICGEDVEKFEINGLNEMYSKSHGLRV